MATFSRTRMRLLPILVSGGGCLLCYRCTASIPGPGWIQGWPQGPGSLPACLLACWVGRVGQKALPGGRWLARGQASCLRPFALLHGRLATGPLCAISRPRPGLERGRRAAEACRRHVWAAAADGVRPIPT